jgi:L-erythro-3,5-diaminohexanoate dehydrogenase
MNVMRLVLRCRPMRGNRFGTHRVLEPQGALPQAAWRLDADTSRVYDDELVLDVERLNIDSASFRQMEEAAEGEAAGVARLIQETVTQRGKQHNPVTGSGGMLVGRVARVGPASGFDLQVGERVATLVSLTLTPLHIDRIRAVHLGTHQLEIDGQAILFASGACARMPADLDERVALAAFDVAGAAPQIARRVQKGDAVLVLGCGGKSGLLVSAAARRAGADVVVGIEQSPAGAAAAKRLGACHHVLVCDATDALAVAQAATTAAGREFDLAVSCVNVADAEMGAILATRNDGVIFFFSMSTSFTRAALGAEGVSRDIEMIIGNGYCVGHAEATLALLRAEPALLAIFNERFAPAPA